MNFTLPILLALASLLSFPATASPFSSNASLKVLQGVQQWCKQYRDIRDTVWKSNLPSWTAAWPPTRRSRPDETAEAVLKAMVREANVPSNDSYLVQWEELFRMTPIVNLKLLPTAGATNLHTKSPSLSLEQAIHEWYHGFHLFTLLILENRDIVSEDFDPYLFQVLVFTFRIYHTESIRAFNDPFTTIPELFQRLVNSTIVALDSLTASSTPQEQVKQELVESFKNTIEPLQALQYYFLNAISHLSNILNTMKWTCYY